MQLALIESTTLAESFLESRLTDRREGTIGKKPFLVTASINRALVTSAIQILNK